MSGSPDEPGAGPGRPPSRGGRSRRQRRADGGQGRWGPDAGWGPAGGWGPAAEWDPAGQSRTEGGPPWTRPRWVGPPRRWFLRRFAGLVIGILLFVILLAALAGFVFASIFGLLGPDRPGQAGWVVVARVVGVILVVGGIAAVLGRIRAVVSPIDELVEATRRVGDGDYSVRVSRPRRAPHELRELAAGFNTMTERLEVDEHQRRSLLADVSHELRNPLAVVRGDLEAIVDGIHPADTEHLTAILDETLVLGRLVEDLRTVALSEAGTLPLHLEPTDLGLLIDDAARSFETMAGAGGIRIVPEVGGESDLPTLDIDPVRIREVLDNLIANALRYTPAGGRVTLTAVRPAGRSSIEVSVTDTGSGIGPDVAEHLFDRFVKTNDSRGSGLGLAIARHIVEAHGGRIEALSRPGAGTTIRFSLPPGEPGPG